MMWARSEWRRRWGSLLLLAVLVTIGGGATISAASSARRTDTAFDRKLQATNAPNLQVSALTDTEIGDLDPALLDRVMQIDGVLGVSEIAFMAVSAVEYPNFFSFAFIDQRGEHMRPIQLEGSRRQDVHDLGDDEVVLNEAMRDLLDAHPGRELQLESATAEQFLASINDDTQLGEPKGPTITATVVSVFRDPEEVSDAKDPFLALSRAFYEKYRESMWSCRCIVTVLAQDDAIDDVAAELALIYPNAVIGPTEDLGARVADTIALQVDTWILMAVTAAVAGALMLLMVSTRFVRSVATADFSHHALGMTRRDSQVGRLLIMSPAVVVGTAGAASFAFAISPFDTVGLARRAEPHPGFHWYWSIGGFGTVATLVAATAIAWICSVVVRHRSEALRHGPRRGGAVVSLGSRLAVGPGRSAVLGVLIATLGVIGAQTLDDSIDHLLVTPVLYGADFDAMVVEMVVNNELTAAAALASDPEIAAVATAWTSGSADNETPMAVIGPGGSIDLVPVALESVKGKITNVVTGGREPLLPDEVAIGRLTMQKLGVDIGDTVTIEGQKGPVQLTVVGETLTLGVDTTGNGFAVTLDGLRTLTDPAVESTAVRYTANADRAAVDARHPELTISPVIPPSEVGNVGQLGDLPTSVAQLLLLLGFVALVSAIVATVTRCRREVAIHRALGFTTRQVVGAHLWQSLATTVVGGAVGGFAGFAIGRAIHHKLASDVGAIADTVVPMSILIVAATAAVVMMVAAFITSAITLRSRPGAVLRAE